MIFLVESPVFTFNKGDVDTTRKILYKIALIN